MAGESFIDKVKAKVSKIKFGSHSATAGGGTGGVRIPAVAAHGTGTSIDSKPTMLEKFKNRIQGNRTAPSGPAAPVA